MSINFKKLETTYGNARGLILRMAELRGLEPEYRYQNESGTELPVAFKDEYIRIEIRDEKIFEILTMGNTEQIQELENPIRLLSLMPKIFTSLPIAEHNQEFELSEAA